MFKENYKVVCKRFKIAFKFNGKEDRSKTIYSTEDRILNYYKFVAKDKSKDMIKKLEINQLVIITKSFENSEITIRRIK